MASEELERRIENLVGAGDTSMPKTFMTSADGKAPVYFDIPLPESLSNRQAGTGDFQNLDIKELLYDYGGQVARGPEYARQARETLVPYLEELTGLNRNDPDFQGMLDAGTRKIMSDQELNMLMANQGARKGISAVENRGLSFAKFLRDTDRTAPEEVINNYALGEINFPTAIGMAQPLPTVDEIVVTGKIPDTVTGQMTPGSGVTDANMIPPMGGVGVGGQMLQGAMTGGSGMTDVNMMELQKALEQLETQRQMTNDPEEKEILGRMIENAKTKAFAPQADLVDQLSQGAGEDDMMAHVRSGDINVSREMLENNPVLEDMIEQAAIDAGVDPESMVYGTGIASLNEITGAEQHGFLKKIAKGVKKVVKVIAPVAAIVPGPWQAPAIAYNRGRAVVNIAKGEGGIGDLMTAAGGFAGDGKMGKFFGDSKIGKAFGDSKIGKFFGGTPGINPSAGETGMFGGTLGPRMRSGIGNLFGGGEGGSGFFNPAEGTKGIFGGSIGPAFRRGIGGLFGGGQQSMQPYSDAEIDEMMATMDPSVVEQMVNERNAQIGAGSFFGRSTPRFIKGIEDTLKGQTDPNSASLFANMPSFRNEQGGLSGMGMLGLGALATGLGKLAYEDTKKQEGVQLTPLLTMNAAGRYNLEAEMARRMGQRPPNPTEFGLLPANTMPQLSGGRPQEVVMASQGGEMYPNKGLEALSEVAPDVVKRMGYNMGGYVMPMAYAEGGNVAVEDFERMNGQINGEGTETSDDVPAMLSDGEFVMTGQAVRGAGTYDMKNNSGIITLSPTGSPSRDGGTDLMYKLMEAFSSQARPA
jgi:hypothetical protein